MTKRMTRDLTGIEETKISKEENEVAVSASRRKLDRQHVHGYEYKVSDILKNPKDRQDELPDGFSYE
jgi:hypothetical protein